MIPRSELDHTHTTSRSIYPPSIRAAARTDITTSPVPGSKAVGDTGACGIGEPARHATAGGRPPREQPHTTSTTTRQPPRTTTRAAARTTTSTRTTSSTSTTTPPAQRNHNAQPSKPQRDPSKPQPAERVKDGGCACAGRHSGTHIPHIRPEVVGLSILPVGASLHPRGFQMTIRTSENRYHHTPSHARPENKFSIFVRLNVFSYPSMRFPRSSDGRAGCVSPPPVWLGAAWPPLASAGCS